ncbi:cytosolic carboxypeptidase 2-like isoform X3 [Lytechinus pictus]|uniref:cytosolic carboxypeptidase 2-like isoform X3 n=1 Tax=Lytechinus pictus TaxID=7653 RepID=UPI00240DAF90|nr:cytosolic carboxypeptidase 2-like isoform X6 [Lytechinus pictus]
MTMKSSSESPYTRNGTVSPSRFPYYRFLPPLKSPPPLSAPPSKPPFREDYYGEHTYTAYDTHRFWVHGPHWPIYFLGELLPTPEHIFTVPKEPEPLWQYVPQDGRTIHTQKTKWYRPWEGTQNVFDSERTSKGTIPHTIPEGCCPSLVFESRFESGNLRQARRIGQFEYDLVLKTDLYTSRHTQWYYFRVQKMRPGVTYKFNIINLLKKDSLYNHGMRPLIYSEKEAEASGQGWVRAGHHISYSRSYGFNKNGLLHPEITYYVLEWQMEFKHEDDTCYLAHCYPFTFTDLCQHLDDLMAQPERRKTMRRDVLCESRAGNSCFLLTVSNFSEHRPKKGIVVTARVHPGETNASWMMRGLLDFITSSDPVAKELRKCYIFKIIPMLNPDGVIVGNYRCSLAGRDLNRNYRHPKKESFPTVWNTKQMLADFAEECEEILVYCDMHGHSRKHNVFIYGCDPDKQELDMAAFLCQRLFPWLLSQKAPDKFSFRGCKFRVKRCKEATGRVVMWRQMGISNSFTLEATFCGSKDITSHAPRHFNLQDFQDLGRHFCEALLVYHQAQENTSLHSELILELTKEITHHILLSRGLLPPNMPFPDLSSLKDVKQGQKSKKHGGSKADQDGSEWAGLDKRTKSKLAALKVIDTLSSETIQGCYDLLADLHINKEFAESDTSDSDSASESELPKGQNDDDDEDKVRKKKRKKKLKGRSKSEEGPAPDMNADEQSKKKTFRIGKCTQAVKKYPPFVNRYAKRSNHGIPMFSQERIQERAKLRMEATKCGDQDTGGGEENALDQVAHDTEYAKLIALSREMHRQSEEVRYKLINQPQEGALEKSLAGMTIRHSYTHGNSMVRGPPPFTLDFERLDSDEMGVLSTLPKTPPRKLDPVKGAAASRSNGGLSRAGALNGISGSDTANGYAITDGLLVGPGMRDGHGGAMKQSSGDASNHRTKGGGPHHPKRTSEEKATGGDNSKLIVFSGKDTKQTSNSFNSSSSASWATGNKGRTKDPSEPNYHSANAAHDKNRHLRKTLGRESTMDLIQRQYGRFLTGVNVNSQGAPSSSTSKYLDSIAKSVPSGNFPSSKEKGAGVTRSASFVNEKRIAPLTKMGDQAAILKLADVKKKSNSSS